MDNRCRVGVETLDNGVNSNSQTFASCVGAEGRDLAFRREESVGKWRVCSCRIVLGRISRQRAGAVPNGACIAHALVEGLPILNQGSPGRRADHYIENVHVFLIRIVFVPKNLIV